MSTELARKIVDAIAAEGRFMQPDPDLVDHIIELGSAIVSSEHERALDDAEKLGVQPLPVPPLPPLPPSSSLDAPHTESSTPDDISPTAETVRLENAVEPKGADAPSVADSHEDA